MEGALNGLIQDASPAAGARALGAAVHELGLGCLALKEVRLCGRHPLPAVPVACTAFLGASVASSNFCNLFHCGFTGILSVVRHRVFTCLAPPLS